MVDFKKRFKQKATAAEKTAAFNAQKPSKKSQVKTPIVMSGVDFASERKAYSKFDGEQGNWIPSENLFGQAFYIKRCWSFESEFGSKVGFEISFQPESKETALFSLTWTEERETYAKTFRALRKKHSEVCIGPMTLIEVPSKNEANDYRKIVPYSDSLAAEYADRKPTTGTRRASRTSTAKQTRQSKVKQNASKINELRARKPGKKTVADTTGDDVSF